MRRKQLKQLLKVLEKIKTQRNSKLTLIKLINLIIKRELRTTLLAIKEIEEEKSALHKHTEYLEGHVQVLQ